MPTPSSSLKHRTSLATATASLTCSFLRPALAPHDLIAHAKVLKAGKRIVYGEVHVYSGEKLVAHATLSFLNSSETPREGVPE